MEKRLIKRKIMNISKILIHKNNINSFNIVFFILLFGSFIIVSSFPNIYANHSTSKIDPQIFDSGYTIEKFADGLQFPTTMDFSDNGIFVLEKNSGKIFHIEFNEEKNTKLVLDLSVASFSESGLLGITVVDEKFVYLFFSQSDFDKWGLDENSSDVVFRYTWNGNKLVDPIFIKSFDGNHIRHHGGVMTNDKEKNVFFFKGDGDSKGIYQNFPNSKNFQSGIFKIDKNNSVELYAMGLRNSFGLAIDPLTGNLWETENSSVTYDEINLIFPKFNGGWELNVGPSNRFDSEIPNNLHKIHESEFQNFTYNDPKFSWYDSIGPTAIAFPSINFKNYTDWLFVGDSNHGNIYKFHLNENRTDFIFSNFELTKDHVLDLNDSNTELLFANIPGIVTDIKFKDDSMYVVSHSDGTIYRIFPYESNSTKMISINSTNTINIQISPENDSKNIIEQITELHEIIYSFLERNYLATINRLYN